MGEELSIILGFVFEGTFKLGFLKDKLKDYEAYKKHVFSKIRQRISESSEDLQQALYPLFLDLDLESITPVGLDINPKNLSLFLSALGYKEGLLYGISHKEVALKKYTLGDESTQVVWENADLVFVDGKTLHVVDFKVHGFRGHMESLIASAQRKEEKYIPFINYGHPVNVSLGELSLEGFLEKFLRVREEVYELEEVFVEIKGFLQLLCYCVDFLSDKKNAEDLQEVSLELLYPLQEPFNVRLRIENREGLRKYLEPIRELYRELKRRESPYREANYPSETRKRRLLEEISKEISKYRATIKELEENAVELEVNPIGDVRGHVKESVKRFMHIDEPCKALVLLHSAGSGKTTTVREHIRKLDGKHIVIYMATRKILVEREFEKIKELEEEEIKAITVEKKAQKQDLLRHEGRGFESVGGKKGMLASLIDDIKSQPDGYRQIWGFATIQTLVEFGEKSTAEHLKKLLSKRIIDQYHLHFILDEFLGYNNGFYAIDKLFEFARDVKSKGGRANLYIFDANGYSPKLLLGILKEYEAYNVVPESLILCEHVPELEYEYKGIPTYLYAKHGYPASKLYVYRKFIKGEHNLRRRMGKALEELVDYICQTFGKPLEERQEGERQSAFVFIQDKDLIVDLSSMLEQKGYSCMIATASSKKSQEEISRGSQDFILGTSAVTRGIDLSREHKPVDYIYILISDWGIENNLVEVIQAISRARGDEQTEKREKHLHLVYLIQKPQDYVIESIKHNNEKVDEEVIRAIYKKEYLKQKLDLDKVVVKIVEQFLSNPGSKALVPVPSQYNTVYVSNRIRQFESVINFLDDVWLMESKRNSKEASTIFNIIQKLYSATCVYTEDIPKDLKTLENLNYYHPYILLERAKLYINVDNEKREEIKKMLEKVESLIKSHNKERYEELVDFLNNTSSVEVQRVPILLPVYSLTVVQNMLLEGQSVKFKLSSRVGRGGARTLGAGAQIYTECYAGRSAKRYACIPLGEDYPYKEVLSGRFAKFPIEFIRALVEDKYGA
ncbi:MAG: helicase [Hydrogenobacter sp.]